MNDKHIVSQYLQKSVWMNCALLKDYSNSCPITLFLTFCFILKENWPWNTIQTRIQMIPLLLKSLKKSTTPTQYWQTCQRRTYMTSMDHWASMWLSNLEKKMWTPTLCSQAGGQRWIRIFFFLQDNFQEDHDSHSFRLHLKES